MQQPPISNLKLSSDFTQCRIHPCQLSLVKTEDVDQLEDESQGSDAVEEDKPEPGEQEDVPVQIIDWQRAGSVVSSGGTTWTILMEVATCHRGQHKRNGVRWVLRIVEQKLDNVKLSSKEAVYNRDIDDRIEESEDIADDHFDSPPVMSVEMFDEVLHQVFMRPISILVFLLPRHDSRDFASFGHQKEGVWGVEENCLNE